MCIHTFIWVFISVYTYIFLSNNTYLCNKRAFKKLKLIVIALVKKTTALQKILLVR